MAYFDMYASMIEQSWDLKTRNLKITLDKNLIKECAKIIVNCPIDLFEQSFETLHLIRKTEENIPGIGIEKREIYEGQPEDIDKCILVSGKISKKRVGENNVIFIKIQNQKGLSSTKELDVG